LLSESSRYAVVTNAISRGLCDGLLTGSGKWSWSTSWLWAS